MAIVLALVLAGGGVLIGNWVRGGSSGAPPTTTTFPAAVVGPSAPPPLTGQQATDAVTLGCASMVSVSDALSNAIDGGTTQPLVELVHSHADLLISSMGATGTDPAYGKLAADTEAFFRVLGAAIYGGSLKAVTGPANAVFTDCTDAGMATGR